MFGKKILFLITGYIAGNAVASAYSSGKKKAKKGEDHHDVSSMVESFLATQKRFIADIEKKYLTEENKEKFIEKKQDFLKLAEKYTQEGYKILQELQAQEKFIQSKNTARGFFGSFFQKFKNTLQQKQEQGEILKQEVQEVKNDIIQEAHILKKNIEKKTKEVKKGVSKTSQDKVQKVRTVAAKKTKNI